MKLRFVLILSVWILGWQSVASAHPVPYQGAVGVMSWNQGFMTDDWITYSFRADTAVAARIMRFDAPEGRLQYFGPQLDYILKRWNGSDYQANVYLYGSYGEMYFQNTTGDTLFAGVEADAETRKYYISAKYEKMWGNLGPDFYDAQARVGIAPYEAEFSEIASWFMVQYQWHPMLVRKYAITPMVRLFYKSVLLEAGVSTDSDWMINFMFHF